MSNGNFYQITRNGTEIAVYAYQHDLHGMTPVITERGEDLEVPTKSLRPLTLACPRHGAETSDYSEKHGYPFEPFAYLDNLRR